MGSSKEWTSQVDTGERSADEVEMALSSKEVEEGLEEADGFLEELGSKWKESCKNRAGGERCMVDKLVCWLVFIVWKRAQVYTLSERREGKLELSGQRRGK